MRRISLVLTVAVVLPFACDADPKDGLFGETAAGPSTPGSAGGSGGAADPDTEGGSDGARSDSEGSDGTGADLPPPPADDGDPPPPPPAEDRKSVV